MEMAAEAVSAIIAAGMTPAALEMLDAVMISAINAGSGAGFPEEAAAVLLIELDGPRAELAARVSDRMLAESSLAAALGLPLSNDERTLITGELAHTTELVAGSASARP